MCSLLLALAMLSGILLTLVRPVNAATATVLYIVDSSGTNKTVTADDSGTGWSYAADTATLTLDGFDGSYIESDGDLKVVLKGTNRLTPDNDKNCVIKAGSGQITIDKSDDDETDQLVIENAAMTQGEFSAFWPGIGDDDALLIQGGTVKVNLTDTNTSCSRLLVASYATVKGDANLDVTLKSSAYYMGIYARLYVKENADVSIKGHRTAGKPGSALAPLSAKDTTGGIYMESTTDSGYGIAFCAESTGSISPAAGGVITAKGMVATFITGSGNGLGNTVKAEPAARVRKRQNNTDSGYYIHSDADGNPIYESTFTGTDEVQPLGFIGGKSFDIPAATVGKPNGTIFLYEGVYGDRYAYFKLVSGTLPEGMTLDGGRIGGTPTAECAAGSVTIEARRYRKEADNTDNDRVTFTISYGAVTEAPKYLTIGTAKYDKAGDSSGTGWSYAADTATLTLDGFDGSYIESDGDLKVVLKGTNRLTPDNDKNCVIKAGSGQITIDKSDDDETDQLVIENAAMTQGEFSAFWPGIGDDDALLIQGGTVKVNLTDTNTSCSRLLVASYATVKGDANLDVTLKSSAYYMGIYARLYVKENADVSIKGHRTAGKPGSALAPLSAKDTTGGIYMESTTDSGYGIAFCAESTGSISPAAGGVITAKGMVATFITGSGNGLGNTVKAEPAARVRKRQNNTDSGYYIHSDADGNPIYESTFTGTDEVQPLGFIGGKSFDIPAATVGKPNGTIFLYEGVYGDRYAYFKLVSGTLPEGMTLDGGRIGGTPTAECAAGSVTIEARRYRNEADNTDNDRTTFTINYGAVTVSSPVTGVTLDQSEMILDVNQEGTLTAIVQPEDATISTVTWKSADESVARVDSTGKVKAVAPGKTTVTATTTQGAKTASAVIYVKEKIPEAGINYRNEMLTGLKSGASYTVSGSKITTEIFTASGITTSIKEEWMGNTITLVCNNTEDKCSSDPQTIVIPERPDAPVGINAVNESYAGAGDGKITGVDGTMMWRRPEGVWLVCTGEEITGLGAGSYQISYMGSDTVFAGKAAEVTIIDASCTHTDRSVVPEKASTCKEKGWNAYEMCNTCGIIFTGDGQIPYRELADHTGGTATCTQKAVCTECGQPYGNYLDHSYTAETKNEETMKTAGTCKEEAVYYYSCSMCGKIEYEDSHIFYGDRDASKHTGDTELRNQKNATCSEEGYTGDTYCLDCNVKLATGTVVEKTAHTPDREIATETEPVRCTVCGRILSEAVIPKTVTVTLAKTSYTYNGKAKKPAVKVMDSDGKLLKKGTDYNVTYAKGRKKVGKYTVKVILKGDNYSGTKTCTFVIKPKSTRLTSKRGEKKAITVKWKKQSKQTSGYQLQYSTKKNFSNAKSKTIKKNKVTKYKIKGLKTKKKYYVRIRTYKNVKVNGKNMKVVSAWSKAYAVKTK